MDPVDVLERTKHGLKGRYYPSGGQMRCACRCGEKFSGFDERSARQKLDAHCEKECE